MDKGTVNGFGDRISGQDIAKAMEPIRGRGAPNNPPNRFERISYEPETDPLDPESPQPTTQFLRDSARSIITFNDSPDVGFEASINPYRGCEHGCIYCYARPTHEVLGFSAGLDFESRILVKEDAPDLLRRELSSSRWHPRVVAISGVTDPYQPIERRLQLTQRCLKVFAEFRNPVAIITKSQLVTRDLNLLQELNLHQAAAVFLSVTSLDGNLSRILEPRASQPAGRLAAIEKLSRGGIPTGVLVAPVIPGLTDHEIPAILTAAAEAGAKFAGYVPLRLPLAVRPLFENWLTLHFSEKKDRVMCRIREIRGGKMNDSRFGSRMTGEGPYAKLIEDLFRLACKKTGYGERGPPLSVKSFRRPRGTQQLLFD